MNTNEFDQRPNESAQEYAWFIGYLALGPARTVSAYVSVHRSVMTKGDKRGHEKRARNRHIEEASMMHHWKERAGAYDLSLIQAELQTSGALVVACIHEYAQVYLNALRTSAVRPTCWDDVLKGAFTLAQLFPPETMIALIQSAPIEQDNVDAVNREMNATT